MATVGTEMSSVVCVVVDNDDEPMEADQLDRSANKITNEEESDQQDTANLPTSYMASSKTGKPKVRTKLSVSNFKYFVRFQTNSIVELQSIKTKTLF